MTAACSVSIIVPAYNSGATLSRAVRSALAQDPYDLEVVIIDDGSRDETGEVGAAEVAADPRVRLITLPRWNGKQMAAADYVTEHAVPNFFFHATTTYALLRHNGVDVGKMDYLGQLNFR